MNSFVEWNLDDIGFDLPAVVGMNESEIQTPCLVLDLDALERNIKKMGEFAKQMGMRHRVHGKMHKSVDVALLQMELGDACGVCCQKVSEAEVFARGGIGDVLVSNQVRDPAKIRRLARLPKLGARTLVCVDDIINVAELSAAATAEGTEIECLVEIDCGAGRCGVTSTAEVVRIAEAIDAAAAVSIDLLARQDSAVLGIVGTGHQSAFQMEAALAIRPFRQVLIWNRSGRSLERHRQIAERFGVELTETDLQAVCRGADALITISSSFAALVCDQWIRPGTHIACMGTDTTGKQEIEPGLALRASRYTDELAQSRTIGEFQHLAKEIGITPIGAVITGQAAGRAAQNEITIYDGTGVGLQDLACARMVVQAFDPIQQGASGKPQTAVA